MGTIMIHAAIVPFLIVSGSYLLAFLLTHLLVTPVQAFFLPDVTRWASLVFLPHGVRVLAAWLYGWWSILLLAPATLLTAFFFYGAGALTPQLLVSSFASAVAAAAAFELVSRTGRDLRYAAGRPARWREVLLVGILASVFNSGGTLLIMGSDPWVTGVRFLGDITGLIVCMLLMAKAFRLQRRWRRR